MPTPGPLSLPVNSLIRNGGSEAAITSLVAGTDGFYGTGLAYGRTAGNFEGAFKADWNGNRIWVEDCHGDTYRWRSTGRSSTSPGTRTTAPGSAASPTRRTRDLLPRARLHHGGDADAALTRGRQLLQLRAASPAPSLLHWFPRFTVGTYTGQSQGPWHVAVGTQLCRLRRGVPQRQRQGPAGSGPLRPGRPRAQRGRSATERGQHGPDRSGEHRLDPVVLAAEQRPGQHPADLQAVSRQRPIYTTTVDSTSGPRPP